MTWRKPAAPFVGTHGVIMKLSILLVAFWLASCASSPSAPDYRSQAQRADDEAAQSRRSLCIAAMLGKPTRTGSIGESMANAAQCN